MPIKKENCIKVLFNGRLGYFRMSRIMAIAISKNKVIGSKKNPTIPWFMNSFKENWMDLYSESKPSGEIVGKLEGNTRKDKDVELATKHFQKK